MKTYKEMAEDALRRAEEQKSTEAKRKKLFARAAVFVFCFAAAVTGIGFLQNAPISEMPPEITTVGAESREQNTTAKPKENPEQKKVITSFPANAVCSYIAPGNGEYLCFIEVNEARKKYAGQDVVFLLAVDIFSEAENGEPHLRDVSDEEKAAEYKRLADDGFNFYEVTYWDYQGEEAKKVYHTALAAELTEEQLQGFKPSEKYGYTFRFITNGDSSGINDDKINAVTNFFTPFIV